MVHAADSHPAISQSVVQSNSHEPASHPTTHVSMHVSIEQAAVSWYWQ